MTKAGLFAASLVAASSAALAAASLDRRPFNSSGDGSGTARRKEDSGSGSGSKRGAENKFKPRFDGLRFIETLLLASLRATGKSIETGMIALQRWPT
ncbi:hypothetical protein Cni_G14655 [Canna indica]|uniref:Uncharacterized protein n=1 Tax=Canna indica TaxID=4628 RepID=A0AAQ3QCK4_9LILI|nr:hypothetical protein Cni_G14655 [Canna indica]